MWNVALSHVTWELVMAAMLLGIGFVFAMPAWLAFVSDISAPRLRGTVIGALGTAQGIGAVIGTALGSHLYTNVSIRLLGVHISSHYAPFFISAIALTLCFCLVLVFIKDGDNRRIGDVPATNESIT
jgi:DHA1 family multidrug resistance protein-like MFS transporter